MSNPHVTDEHLAEIIASAEAVGEKTKALPPTLLVRLAYDLRDARARILELERYSASQEEALGMMERGNL